MKLIFKNIIIFFIFFSDLYAIEFKGKFEQGSFILGKAKIGSKISIDNRSEKGAYTVNLTSHESKVTLVASGTEVELALRVQKNLKDNNIHSKVVSMPCMELFDKQPENFRKDIIEENSLIFTIEAGSIMSWQKYVKNKGMNIGIDEFGESAPYKEVYNHLGLSEEKIINFIQKKLRE